MKTAMKMVKKWLAPVMIVAILGTFAVGAALAENSNAPAPPAAPSSSQSQQELYKLFLSNLATTLGIDEDTLTAGLKTACTETVNQEVADGTITQEQADQILSRVDDGNLCFAMFGPGPGGPGGHGGPGPKDGKQQPPTADQQDQ